MKIAGIVGGLGPESTIEYYRQILAAYREQRPDLGNPPIVINSVNMKLLLNSLAAGDLDKMAQYLSAEIKRLADAGAQFAVISANTPHIVFDRVCANSPIPLISIVEATCEAAQELGATKLGLFGTRFVMQGRFYPEAFSSNGMELVVPVPSEQDYIHQIYFEELVKGTVLPETREKLLTIVDRLRREQGIQALILGGTEL